MAARIQKPKSKAKQKSQESQSEEVVVKSATTSKLMEDLDSILDEIDEVLEDNAQEFVESYIQRGGE